MKILRRCPLSLRHFWGKSYSSPPNDAPPRSIVVKFLSYKIKEEVLKQALHKKGFLYMNKKINLDHDYAPEVLRKRREYAEAKKTLAEKKIRFQTP